MKPNTKGYLLLSIMWIVALIFYAIEHNQYFAWVFGFATGYLVSGAIMHYLLLKHYKNKPNRPTHSVREGEF